MNFFPKPLWQTTKKLLANGALRLAVSTMRLVLVVLLPVAVLICLSLTTHIRNKT